MEKDLAHSTVKVNLAVNILLVVLKTVTGIASGSATLLAEAIHSGGDIAASIVVLIGVRLSVRPPDDRHHFGHGKIESVSSCLIAMLLVVIGFLLCRNSLARLSAGTVTIPGLPALYVSLVCIAVKELMYRRTVSAAKKTCSVLLFADAWHHRSDMMILTGVLAGLAGARMGFPAVDGLAALGISALIIRLGVTICWRGLGDLVDTAPDPALLDKIRETVRTNCRVEGLHSLRARQHGSEVHLELHIGVDGELPVASGHEVAKDVKSALLAACPQISHVVVHINPVPCSYAKPQGTNQLNP